MTTSFGRIGLALLLLFTLVGCKVGKAKDAGFVDHKVMVKDPELPFHLAWKKEGLNLSQYTRVYVPEANTSHMLAMTDWQKGDRKEQYPDDLKMMGRYVKSATEKAFTEDPRKRMIVVDHDTKSSDTMVIEFALVEVVPSKVVLNALGYAPFFIGTGIKAVRAIAQDQSTVAFEARFKDASTGDTLVMLADREGEQSSLVSVRGLTWYSHTQTIISQWAFQFVQVVNKKEGEVIKDTDPFTLQPW